MGIKDFSSNGDNAVQTGLQSLCSNMEDLNGAFETWKRNYGHLVQEADTTLISNRYSYILDFLGHAKTEMARVYTEARAEETNILSKMALRTEQVSLLTLKMQGYMNLLITQRQDIMHAYTMFDLDPDSFIGLMTSANDAISEELIEKLYAYYSEDNRWEELLAKDGESITKEEYLVLIMVFLELDDNSIEDFVNQLFEKVGTYEDNLGDFINENISNYGPQRSSIDYVACDYYQIDADKVAGLSEAMSTIINNNFLMSSLIVNENSDLAENELTSIINRLSLIRNELLQKANIFKALSAIDQVSVTSGNMIDIDFEGSIVLSYHDIGDVTTLASSVSSNMMERTIIISPVATGLSNAIKNQLALTNELILKYGITANVGAAYEADTSFIAKFALETSMESLSEYALAKGVEMAISNLIGVFPGAGDIASFVIDGAMACYELREDRAYAEHILQGISDSNYATIFDLSTTSITFSDADIADQIFIEPSLATQLKINRISKDIDGILNGETPVAFLNDEIIEILEELKDMDITTEDVLNNPEEIYQKILDLEINGGTDINNILLKY